MSASIPAVIKKTHEMKRVSLLDAVLQTRLLFSQTRLLISDALIIFTDAIFIFADALLFGENARAAERRDRSNKTYMHTGYDPAAIDFLLLDYMYI